MSLSARFQAVLRIFGRQHTRREPRRLEQNVELVRTVERVEEFLGRAQRLATEEEVEAADELPLRPWLPTLKYHYVRVSAESMSGRRFRRGPEPDRYGIADY